MIAGLATRDTLLRQRVPICLLPCIGGSAQAVLSVVLGDGGNLL
jgi:hypothetical protein